MISLEDLKVLIIEDDVSESLDLLLKLEKIGVTKIVSASTFEESREKINDNLYDLAFVDILLNQQEKGLELAELLSAKNIPFITTTNLTDLSVFYNLIEYNPIAYFQKPVDPLELRYRLETISESLKERKSNFLFHKDGSEYIKVKKENIIYIEADGNYTTIHTKKKKFMLRTSLKKLLQKIDSTTLIQVHRKWVIRLDLIDYYNGQTKKATIGELNFPVGRKFQPILTKHLVNS